MSNHLPGFQSFFQVFVLAKLATSSIKVNKLSSINMTSMDGSTRHVETLKM